MKFPIRVAVYKHIQFTGDNVEELFNFCGEDLIEKEDGSLELYTPDGDKIINLKDIIFKDEYGDFFAYTEHYFHHAFTTLKHMDLQSITITGEDLETFMKQFKNTAKIDSNGLRFCLPNKKWVKAAVKYEQL